MSVLPRSAEALPGPVLSHTFHLPPGGGCLFVNSTTPPPRSRDQNVPALALKGSSVAAQAAVRRTRFRTRLADRNTGRRPTDRATDRPASLQRRVEEHVDLAERLEAAA